MPRIAFALPQRPDRVAGWRAAVAEVEATQASAHRTFLLDRGIYRERVWLQQTGGSAPLTLVLWDCDDVEAAARPLAPGSPAHERWLLETAVARFHDVDVDAFALPEAEVLSGTTAASTATGGTQTMLALPVPDRGLDAVRALMERIEHGDLAGHHVAFLTGAGVREEWVWLQPPTGRLPAQLLVHWIVDDLAAAWQQLDGSTGDPYARALHDALFTAVVGHQPQEVATWEIEQVLAMHVRRSDSADARTGLLAARVEAAVARGRWDVVRRSCRPQVDGGAGPEPADAVVDRVRAALGPPRPVRDTLVGRRHVALVLAPAEGLPGALLLAVDAGSITGLAAVPTWS